MPAAKSMAIRREIIQRCEAGESQAGVARALSVSSGMVRKLWRQYREQGQIRPNYDRCGPKGPRQAEGLYQQAVALKAAHPGWGAGLIRVELATQFGREPLPSQRTLQRWFRRAGVARPRPERTAKPTVKRGQAAHEVWAVDAKEQIQLADGSYVSWLTITDEGSGAILVAALFPPPPLDGGGAEGGQTGAATNDEPVGTTRTDSGR
jgi:transposase